MGVHFREDKNDQIRQIEQSRDKLNYEIKCFISSNLIFGIICPYIAFYKKFIYENYNKLNYKFKNFEIISNRLDLKIKLRIK